MLSLFQSTPPARGATVSPACLINYVKISIHAPREGGDLITPKKARVNKYFNPRPPRGGRLGRIEKFQSELGFQSTPPARGATSLPPRLMMIFSISIHAPREGGDGRRCFGNAPRMDFNPRPPRGGRRRSSKRWLKALRFQSTPPARGATAKMHSFICESLTNK